MAADPVPGEVRRVHSAATSAADDDDEYACAAVFARSSTWVSRDGGVIRKLYHDTGRWSDAQRPRCDAAGSLRYGRQRVERLIALAWHADERGTYARVRPDPDVVALNAASVEWVGTAPPEARRPPHRGYVPPCARRARDAALELWDARDRAADEDADFRARVDALAQRCGVPAATALTYLAKAAATDEVATRRARVVAAGVAPCLRRAFLAAGAERGRGSNTEVLMSLAPALAEWGEARRADAMVDDRRCLHSQIHLLRVDAGRGDDG